VKFFAALHASAIRLVNAEGTPDRRAVALRLPGVNLDGDGKRICAGGGKKIILQRRQKSKNQKQREFHGGSLSGMAELFQSASENSAEFHPFCLDFGDGRHARVRLLPLKPCVSTNSSWIWLRGQFPWKPYSSPSNPQKTIPYFAAKKSRKRENLLRD
jgi:hypothetical protein